MDIYNSYDTYIHNLACGSAIAYGKLTLQRHLNYHT